MYRVSMYDMHIQYHDIHILMKLNR